MNGDLIRRLVEDDPVPAMLNGAREWRRVFGRISGSGALLVYEPESGATDAMTVTIGENGREIECRPWWSDPALPALGDLVARHRDIVPIRYRPAKRCTLRKGELFVKCVADARGDAINRDARLLHTAERRGYLSFGVARPAGWLPGIRAIAQHRVEGAPVAERLWSPDGLALARRLGSANASLALAPIRPANRFTYADQQARTGKYARRLAKRLPGCSSLLAELMARLSDIAPGPADRPIHGAPHAHQWLDGPDGIKLVDFDRFSLGDPELDAATFVAEADFEASPYAAAAGEAYRQGYESIHRLDPALMLAYRAHKHIAKALRVSTAIRLDAAQRSREVLAGALQLLERGP